ncbi:hypothetical protein [Sphaerisporangium sp. NPDC051011]|uniref:hypothetical protein n=1 Tax=Sphaerisporangium sp. NPDC051011 TaxID=3155792 RepID=UPI0033FEE012
MVFDSGVVTSYVAAAQTRPVADLTIRALLDGLAARVAQQLGELPLHDLRQWPNDPNVRAHVAQAIDLAAATDTTFADDLARAQVQLDGLGASALTRIAYMPYQAAATSTGPAFRRAPIIRIGGGRSSSFILTPASLNIVRRGPGWAKRTYVTGLIIFVLGFATFVIGGFTGIQSGDTHGPNGLFVFGFVTAFIGVVVTGTGIVGAGLSRSAVSPAEQATPDRPDASSDGETPGNG